MLISRFDTYADTFEDTASSHKITDTLRMMVNKKSWGKDRTVCNINLITNEEDTTLLFFSAVEDLTY